MNESSRPLQQSALVLVCAAVLAIAPYMFEAYGLGLLSSMLMYTAMATAWSIFSSPTRYVSLATAAFFGIGAYTTAAVGESLGPALTLCIAAAIGFLVALVVGLVTLRLAGVYFVIFTFGLAELIRQLVTWWEAKFGGTLGRYVFIDVTQNQIYWQLLGVAALVFLVGVWVRSSRIGWAAIAIGEDEQAARHIGVNATKVKVLLFAGVSTAMSIVGAVMAPRWTYIDPAIAFNPLVSFQTMIMALLGGGSRLYGPALGVVPLVILSEVLQAQFPNYFSLMLGIVFLAIVYLMPNGVTGLLDSLRASRRPRSHVAPQASKEGAL